jgi:hypothetical protein
MQITPHEFKQTVRVPSARDPTTQHEIPAGIYPIVFDDFVTRTGRIAGTECEVCRPNTTSWRIFRDDLMALCASGKVVPVEPQPPGG